MPRLPKWLGDTMDVVFSKLLHQVEVKEINYITERIKRVRFCGDFSKVKFVPGNVIEFRINANDYRHYTPSLWDINVGNCDVLFYLHHLGEGSRWADQIKVGDKMKLMGPGGKMSYQSKYSNHFVFGDETSLGLIECMQNEAKNQQHHFSSLVELENINMDYPKLLDLYSCTTVSKNLDQPASHAITHLKESNFFENIDVYNTIFYLTGRAKSIQAIRKFLISEGIEMKQIKTEPYWAEGKKGL